MGTEHQSLRLTPSERRRLRRALQRQQHSGEGLRAAIILWSAQGQSAASIARTLGVTVRTVYRCRQRWRSRGLEGLADSPRPGRPPRVSPAALEVLLQTADTDPRHLGFVFSRWTSARLAAFLKQRLHLTLSPAWVNELLHCHGFA